MKRFLGLLLVFLISFSSTYASHVLGGEVSWRCLSNGKYVFFMSIYRDCTGIPWNYDDETLMIAGNPLPANGVSSIVMSPDRNRFLINRNGDTSPTCTPQYGSEVSCPNGDEGTVQAFYYQSAPVELTGTPPSSGWKFAYVSPCCRPGNIANVNTTGTMLLRAIMYPGPNGLPANPCYDSSPEFRALPTTLICRGYEFTYNHTAIDFDLDELQYSWDRPYNPPAASPIALTYKPNYSPTSPTPNANANLNNLPATLDPLTGITRLAVYSGTGIEKFITVVKVDSYRDGIKVATVYREIPISLFDCVPLPNGFINNVPEVQIDGIPQRGIITDIVAGQTVSIPVQVTDNDITGVGTQLQTLTLVPDGLLFTASKTNGTPCEIPGVEPCAFLRNRAPVLDASVSPSKYQITGLGSISTEFVWQTDCKHISTKTGFPGTNQGVYNFVMRVFDDHCPIPALNYPTITVRVRDPIPMTEPIMKGISVGLDGAITYSWVPPYDTAFDLHHYEAVSSRPNNGFQPTIWNDLNKDIRIYSQDKKALATTFPVYDFINPLIPAQGIDLFSEFGNKAGIDYDFYARMRSSSGCTDTIKSIYSQPVRVMELESTPIGVAPQPLRSEVQLSWNRPKPLNASTYPYFAYESPTHFYIWANDSVSGGGIADPNNWYVIGQTTGTTYNVGATSCNDYVGFRIEARDTVFYARQGTSDRQYPDSITRGYYSTFSVLDTVFMKAGSFIPDPKLDTIQVTDNGQVFIRIDLTGKRTTSNYNIYEGSIAPANLLASITADEDSVLLPITGALASVKNIVIEAIDGCDPTIMKNSLVYNTFIPTGMPGAPCKGEYILNWTQPGGFPAGVVAYQVMVDRGDGNGYVQEGAITGGNNTTATITGIQKSTSYKFQIIAIDGENAVNISAPHIYNAPAVLAKDDIVPSPTPRCTYVNDNGSVKLSWIQALDTVANFGYYDIEYREVGGTAWNQLTDDDNLVLTDESYTITGINAQNAGFEFRIRTTSGCDGRVPADWTYINSVFVTATPQVGDPQKRGDILWNPTLIDYGAGNYMDLYKDTFDTQYGNLLYKKAVNTNALLDDDNGDVCDGIFEYHIRITDSLFAPAGFRCDVRSNLAQARYEDTLDPGNQKLLYVSFNLLTRGLDAYWGANAGDVNSLSFLTTNGFNSGLQAYREIIPKVPYDTNETSFNFHEIDIPYTALDARDTSVVVAAQAEDACGNIIDEEDLFFHKTMDIEVEWDVCDSVNRLAWNPYVGFDEADTVFYDVMYTTTTNGQWTFVETVADTLYEHLVILGDRNYRYHVRAYTKKNPTYVSNSSIDSAYASYAREPNFGYLTYATVLPTNDVEIEFYKDTLIKMNGYTIFRGTREDKLNPIGYIRYSDVSKDNRVYFTDIAADVDNASYYYQILTENACDIPIATSNFGRTIHLQASPDNAGLTNTLTWNNYEEWDSTVAYYNIYRGIDEDPTSDVYKVVKPNTNYRLNTFIDDVYANLFSKGKFCYRIEAVQGAISSDAVNGYSHDLTPATSNSNKVCVVQNPIMYIPNAFAPDGINRVFGPKGQFFNYSQFEMSIYNRWGEQIYVTRDLNKGWDGTVNGEIASLGSYVYMIRFVDADGKEHRKKGTLTLIK